MYNTCSTNAIKAKLLYRDYNKPILRFSSLVKDAAGKAGAWQNWLFRKHIESRCPRPFAKIFFAIREVEKKNGA
jgi:hypothetical protein